MNDMIRCANHQCPRKYDCLRYTARADLHPHWARYRGDADCQGFVPDRRLGDAADDQCQGDACRL